MARRVEGPGVVSTSPWLTVEQAAAYLSMSRSAQYRAIRDSDLVPDECDRWTHRGCHGHEGGAP
jgi:hypothetical protein